MTQKDWLLLSIFTFVIVVVWIVLDVYHAYTTSTVSSIDEKLMEQLVPKFDHETIIKLVEEN